MNAQPEILSSSQSTVSVDRPSEILKIHGAHIGDAPSISVTIPSNRSGATDAWIPLPSLITASQQKRSYAATIFYNLFHVLDHMGSLPQQADQAIDEETKEEAEEILNLIQQYDIDPPKVFSHGGDAVVFTWSQKNRNRYLTVSGGEIAVLDVDRASRIECAYPLIPMRSLQLGNCMAKLGPSKGVTNAEPR